MKDAFIEPPVFAAGAAGKNGLKDYLQHGYIPEDSSHQNECVSMTLGIITSCFINKCSFFNCVSYLKFFNTL